MSQQEIVELELEYVDETDRAILFTDGEVERWIQKSLIEDMEETSNGTTIRIPEWIALKKGLI